MEDFFQTPQDLPPVEFTVGSFSYSTLGVSSHFFLDIENFLISRGHVDLVQKDSATPAATKSATLEDIGYSTILAGGFFLDALLAAQLEASRGPRYPTTGQRWPWKAFG